MKTCIIADESRVIRMVSKKIMESLLFSVLEAEDGEEVISLCDKQIPDLILLDIKFQTLNGLEVVKRIKEQYQEQAPKVIFCSSVNEKDKIAKFLNNGADEVIMKPFDSDILKSKLVILGLVNER